MLQMDLHETAPNEIPPKTINDTNSVNNQSNADAF